MDQFQISEKLQLYFLLFIDKRYHEKVILVTHLPFVKTKPFEKEVPISIFTESAPRLVQSSSCNIHYKDGGLKPL